MRKHLIDRRTFLAAAGAGFGAALLPRSAEALDRQDAVFASAYRAPNGGFGIATLGEDGTLIDRYALPARGHDTVWHPNGKELVAFARRPGTFAAIIDTTQKREPRIISAAPGRHFYGHGCFSADGARLFATENDFDAARGVIGVYDVTNNYARIAEFFSGGVGPHDAVMLPDQHHLVIANGGIETHPDYPRTKLNIATMAPNLTVLGTRDGSLKHVAALPPHLHKLSIRHLAADGQGNVWFACQNEGDVTEPIALAGRLSNDGNISLASLPDSIWSSLRGYIGSIACSANGRAVAITSPRGGVAYQMDVISGQILHRHMITDVCGVAQRYGQFTLSSGTGHFGDHQHALAFDNHLTSS